MSYQLISYLIKQISAIHTCIARQFVNEIYAGKA